MGIELPNVEDEAKKMPTEELQDLNRFFDEYILRQLRFKSELIDEVARLHENVAYAILGVDPNATNEEIKKAYRRTAMECHPDKGGDKEEFQELNNAFEKIMEQRRGSDCGKKNSYDEEEEIAKKERKASKTKEQKEKNGAKSDGY